MSPTFRLALAALAVTACRTEQTIVTPDPHLERMLDQPKTRAYEGAPLLPGDTSMQPPPEGTLPVDAPLETSVVTEGGDAKRLPGPIDRRLLQTGRARFEVYCAVCHGVLGDGVSAVARHMVLRKPPNIVTIGGDDVDPGPVFRAVRQGYGLMPSYAAQLSVDDTWAVAAYLQALRIARNSKVSDLPPDVRAQLEKEAP
jgi:mono/diheme cytochrome c family protein